ncbi:MAG: LamG-like jellyroll fold domain-containing protein, partial [Rhodothermaceae bacterium]
GIDCAIKGYETSVDWDELFPADKEHNTSVGLYRPDDFLWYQPNTMEERLKREKRFWSGENGDPSNTETSHKWKGFANYIPANSVIDDVPFSTNFSLGLGYDYYINGEKLSDTTRSSSGWNNIALQDILPTWRWLVESSGSKLDVNFDFTDAYYGGNSIKFSGNLSSDNNVKLYKTKLPVTGSTKIDVAVKRGKAGASSAKIGLAFDDAPSSFQYLEIGDLTDENWNLKTLDLSSYAGKTLSVISIFFEANSESDYELKLGRISLYNEQIKTPAAPSNFTVENKVNEDGFITLRLKWDHSSDKVTQYNVYKKNPDNSRTFIGGSINNACFIPWVGKAENESDIVLELEAVGEDFGHSSAVTADFNWYSAPEKASNPNPASGATDIYRNTKLVWTAGRGSEAHSVYFGKSQNVQAVDVVSVNEFDPGMLEANTTYYWRVDEKNKLFTTTGELWSFTTGAGILDTSNNALNFDGVDDFVNCGNDASLQITGREITIEAWVNAETFKAETWQGVILAKDQGGAGSDFGYMLRCGKDGRVNFNVGNGQWNEIETQGLKIKLNTWHHVAGVMEGGYMRIYIDGKEEAKKALYSTTVKNAANANLIIGDSPAFPGRVFDGKIDEVRIWNKGRTAEQINTTMNMKLTPEYYSTADSGLAAYWNFDEGAGQTLADLSTHGNDAILGASNASDSRDPKWDKSSAIVSVDEIPGTDIPENFALNQNYPNPFNPSTTITFSVTEEGLYKLQIFNILGQEVDVIFDKEIAAGNYKVTFEADHLSSGIYFYRLTGKGKAITKKMLFLK